MARLIAEERILWPNKVDGRPRLKKFLREAEDTLHRSIFVAFRGGKQHRRHLSYSGAVWGQSVSFC